MTSTMLQTTTAAGWRAYVTVGGAIGVTLATSGAPSPTYVGFAELWGFPPLALTFAYAAYGFGVIIALLTTGGISDRVGRRPVLIASLLILTASMLGLAVAPGLPVFIFSRLVQGVAAGMLTGAAGAALAETHPRADVAASSAANSMTTSLGIAAGAVLAGTLISAGGGLRMPFVVMAALSLLSALTVAAVLPRDTETTGRWLRLQRLSVPPAARPDFVLASMCVIAAWSVGGLYLALGGTLATSLVGLSGPLVPGLVILAVQGFGAVVQYLWVRFCSSVPDEGLVSAAVSALATGTMLTAVGAAASIAVVGVLGALVSGAGFGLAFMCGTRLVSVAAPPERRGEAIAAYFVVAYLAISVPAIVEGFLIQVVGVASAFIIFTGVVLAICLVIFLMLAARRRARRVLSPRASAAESLID